MFGGARGGGKTDGVLGEWAKHAAQYGEHATGLMVRRSRVELVETIERSKQIYSRLGATFNESKSVWRFKNGARLRFGYLERDSDADQFQGWSLTRLYVEEVGTFPSEKPINKLMATLRSGHGVPVKFIATGNPGGVGQNWVKERWIKPNPAGNTIGKRRFRSPFTGDTVEWDWVFIPSKVTDNAYLGNDYIAQLQQVGSSELVRAWLQGDWDAVEGAFFSEWDENRHVVPAELVVPDKLNALFFRSIDLGFASPFSVGWWAHLNDDLIFPRNHGHMVAGENYPAVLPKGALLRIKEWYGAARANVGLRLPAEVMARGILNRDPIPQSKIAYTTVDPSGFKEEGGPSHAERMAGVGINCIAADNKRVGELGHWGGWDVMRQRLRGDVQERPMIATVDSCDSSIRTIPVLQHDPDHAEDLETDQEDHAADEWRYACMSRPWHLRPILSKATHKFDDYIDRTDMPDINDWVAY